MSGEDKGNVAKRSRADEDENENHDSGKSSSAMIPEGLLPSYLSDAFADLYGEDGLLVLGKGLGWLSLLAVFVRFYGDVEEGHVAVSSSYEDKSKSSTVQKTMCGML